MSFHSCALAAIASCSACTAGIKPLLHIDRGRDVHGRGKGVVRRLRHVDVVVGMNRRLAAERRAGELAAAVGDHFVHVHVELRAAAGHPHVQREHVVVLAGEDLVADLNDQLVRLVVEPLAGMVGVGGGFLQDGIGGDHLARDQILADAEMLERALGLCAPELVGRNIDLAETVGFLSDVADFASSPLRSDIGQMQHRRSFRAHAAA